MSNISMVSLCPSKICQRIHRLKGGIQSCSCQGWRWEPRVLFSCLEMGRNGRPGAEPSGWAEITQRQLLEVWESDCRSASALSSPLPGVGNGYCKNCLRMVTFFTSRRLMATMTIKHAANKTLLILFINSSHFHWVWTYFRHYFR